MASTVRLALPSQPAQINAVHRTQQHIVGLQAVGRATDTFLRCRFNQLGVGGIENTLAFVPCCSATCSCPSQVQHKVSHIVGLQTGNVLICHFVAPSGQLCSALNCSDASFAHHKSVQSESQSGFASSRQSRKYLSCHLFVQITSSARMSRRADLQVCKRLQTDITIPLRHWSR